MFKSLYTLLGIAGLTLLLVSCQTKPPLASATAALLDVQPSSTPTNPAIPTETTTVTKTSTVEAFIYSATPVPTITASPTATLQPGAIKVSDADGMILVFVPAGKFLMGSSDADPGADYDEFPQHEVFLDAYWIDQTVVTNAMYAIFLTEMGNQAEGRATWLDSVAEDVLIYEVNGEWLPKSGFGDYPVLEVTWFGAQAYCQWAGRRLPTEAEWEKSARGTDMRTYPWGEELDCDRAQVANCSGSLLSADSKPSGASPYGVFGLSGNVWEWVYDWYAADNYGESASLNPTGPDDGISRVLRGGAWEYDWKHARAANRRHNGPAVSMPDYGFRCVISETDN